MRKTLLSSSLTVVGLLCGCSGSTPTKDPVTSGNKESPPSYTRVDPATAASVSGKISFKGRRPARQSVDLDQDPVCVKAHGKRTVPEESLVVNPDGTLRNAFIYIKAGLEGKAFEPSASPATIDQKGCWFSPRVVGIQAGQRLAVTNSDPLTHNIHPMAELNREWNQSQAAGDPPLRRRFLRQEIMIPVKCNIHGWMRAFIGVVDHPFFAVSGPDGSFSIKNLPPGSYTLAAWHEKLGVQEQKIELRPSDAAVAAFTFIGD